MSITITYLFSKSVRYCHAYHGKFILCLLASLLAAGGGYGQLPHTGNLSNSVVNYPKNADTNYIILDETTNIKTDTPNISGDNEAPYDEITIMLNVQRIGSLEIPAIIYQHQAYLSVQDIFDYLKIKNKVTPEFDSISGYFIHPDAKFLIDYFKNRILYQNKIFDAGMKGMIRTETSLYMRSDIFGKVFGLECIFDFRSLSVNLNSKTELPAIREMQQELMRLNINRVQGERKADTTIGARFSLFHFGVADWSVIHMKEGDAINNTNASLSLGAILAGGELNFQLNYASGQKFIGKNQFYSWRYVNNENNFMRQLTVGKVFAQSTSSVFAALKGIQITNAPSTYRKSFGTYRLSDHTEPGWMVELYVNNILVNYMKADASGFFSFDVPMVYGNSVVRLRFYGPWGEERIKEKNLIVPFNFLPIHQLEYSITAGVVDNDSKTTFSKAVVNYGLSRYITIGSGMEYLASANAFKVLPFANVSMRIGSNLLLSGDHMPGVRTKGVLSYRLPSSLQLDVNYTTYKKEQTVVLFNYLEETKASISIPFRRNNFSAFSRLSVTRITSANEKITAPEFLFSTVVAGISSHFKTSVQLTDHAPPFLLSSLSMTFHFPEGWRVTPQLQYEYREQNFNMLKLGVEKSLRNRGFVTLSYEKDVLSKMRYITAGLRLNFSFAQTSFSVRDSKNSAVLKEQNSLSLFRSARGSIIYDDISRKVIVSNQDNVGRGGLLFSPFLDLNCNGRRDANEPRVSGLKVRVNGGRQEQIKKDSTIRVLGLEAYTSYYVELNDNSFENIAWRIKQPTMSIAVEPNHIKLIEIPVAVMAEVSGFVYLRDEKAKEGLGRIIVNIYNSDSALVAKTLTEQDGYFTYMGLSPGNYTVVINEGQLKNLNMKASSAITFRINSNREGDVVDRLEFVLEKAR